MQIQYFLAVHKYKGFTRAAQLLHLNQSTISRQIAALEDELGAVLFIRTAGGIRLTEAGEFFLEEGTAFLRRYESMCRRIGSLGVGTSGTLVVGMPMNLFGSGGILGDYDRSLQSNDVAFRYCLMDFDALNTGLINGDIDIAITYDFAIQNIKEAVKAQFLFKEPFLFFVKQGHPLAGKQGLTVSDLLQTGLVLLESNIVPRFLNRVLNQARLEGSREIVYTKNHDSLLMEVSAGDGVGVIPKTMFESNKGIYGLAALDIPELDTSASFVIAQNANNKNPLISTYHSFLKHYIAKRKW